MKILAVPAIVALLAAPAWAQSSGSTSGSNDSSTSPTTSGASTQSGSGSSGMSGTSAGSDSSGTSTSGTTIQQRADKLRQALTDAGFQDVEVLDASYLVKAETADGETVFMMINPPAR